MTYEATYIAAVVAENWGQYETHGKTYCPEPRGKLIPLQYDSQE
jgi:hypothetical protein